eukprot:15438435-Alexandrium_andersonii.AAC.1
MQFPHVPPAEEAPAFRAANLVLPALPAEWEVQEGLDADPDLDFTAQRAWLLTRIFALLDRDGDGRLNSPEAFAMAHLCGATTSAEAWPE